MIVLKVDANSPDPAAIRRAADAILRGELLIFPTETVYGLAANALDDAAVRRVFEAKGRQPDHPLPVQVAGVDQLGQVASGVSDDARILASRFWPGPLTLVMPKSDRIPAIVSGGADTIGVRVPNHPVALALLRELGQPIVATSANRSGTRPPIDADEAARELEAHVGIVLDGGRCRFCVASTVIDLSVSPPRVLREGVIGVDVIRQALGRL